MRSNKFRFWIIWAGLLPAAGLTGAGERSNQAVSNTLSKIDESAYQELYPRYAVFCAATQIKKPTSPGLKYSGGAFGHAFLYLQGACRDKSAPYPVLKICDSGDPDGGVGVSTDGAFKNVNWIAVESRDFFFNGTTGSSQKLDVRSYEKTLERAREMDLLRGVQLKDSTRKALQRPDGMSDRDYDYEYILGTDFGLRFGRNLDCGRVPLDQQTLTKVVADLNQLNDKYHNHGADYDDSWGNNNCTTTAHNALSVAGVWTAYDLKSIPPIDIAVPYNNFVDFMDRTNDLPIEDPLSLYSDSGARAAVLNGTLPVRPGAIAEQIPMIPGNTMFETDSTGTFLDFPIFNPTKRGLQRDRNLLRYIDLRANTLYFFQRLQDEKAKRQPWEYWRNQFLSTHQGAGGDLSEFQDFYTKLTGELDQEFATVQSNLNRMSEKMKASR